MKKFATLLALAFLSIAAHAAPTCTVGAAGVAPIATLTFTAPTQNTDGTPIATPLTYSVYQGTTSGGEVKVGTAASSSPVIINTGLADGSTFYFYITVTDAHGTVSAPSNEGCKTFPAGVPGTVIITLTKLVEPASRRNPPSA
jgi:hypothetical protein